MFMFMIGACIACSVRISFNPHKVPSIRVNGVREPLCRGCAQKWNRAHPANARPIHPDAYKAVETPQG